MKRKELTPKQLSSVPCPTCAAAAGSVACCIQVLRDQNHTETGSLPLLRPSRGNEFTLVIDVDKLAFYLSLESTLDEKQGDGEGVNSARSQSEPSQLNRLSD